MHMYVYSSSMKIEIFMKREMGTNSSSFIIEEVSKSSSITSRRSLHRKNWTSIFVPLRQGLAITGTVGARKGEHYLLKRSFNPCSSLGALIR